MGCFLACFGNSKKDRKRRRQRNQVQPRDQYRNASFKAVQSVVSSVQEESERPISLVSEVRDKPEEQPSLSTRKKVTFDSNVKTYEHVSTHEDSEKLPESEDATKTKEDKEDLANLMLSKSFSEDSSITSSLGSYPPNHRYQNCRDSDDEDEELDFGDSDLDDEDDEYEDEDDGEIDYEDEIVDLKRRNSEEVNSPMPVSGLLESEIQPIGLNRNARDRSGYVHSVLNPVENLSQWKAIKAKGTPKMKPQKENFILEQEPWISFSSEPAFKELSLSFKSKKDQPTRPKQEVAVDASLSNWLATPETKPVNKTSSFAFSTFSPDRSTSQGSNSVRSQEDRPILGALTVEELRQYSASNSPRKSPSRSPDEMPIIGTVGTYWSHSGNAKDSGSASSFKGVPNTTSKYREDKNVNWHSTPFETRLERALNRGAAEAYSTTYTPCAR
ncbi:eisosome protein [Parasponia andersonii]|uniref:Eisosome protein n=1 Tax=Parasponia andersonii TaxID=3476 RepID=A0A2P5B6C1_PARAD|nr:eisosome protein [Parasponia andersonii]